MRVKPLLALLPLLAACSLSPRPDASRYFTLPDPAGAAAPSSPATPASAGAPSPAPSPTWATAGLGPLTFPPWLSRPEVARRIGPGEIGYAANDRWAAPFEDLASRALSEELRRRLPAREVVRWPWQLGTPPEIAVSVEFTRLESDAAGGATLHARWTVSRPGRPPIPGETRVSEPGPAGDVPASVGALARALGRLGADLAAAAGPAAGR